jgi:hypothetical protein
VRIVRKPLTANPSLCQPTGPPALDPVCCIPWDVLFASSFTRTPRSKCAEPDCWWAHQPSTHCTHPPRIASVVAADSPAAILDFLPF